jgi:SagB-type dehydrogenase family enzyme
MNDSPPDPRAAILTYHEGTKHTPALFAPGPRGLDWVTQPEPFRRWIGADRIPLDVSPITGGPPCSSALLRGGVPPVPLDRRSISRLLRDSLSLSAWKQSGGARWPLRVNPSSGNLHPTEGQILLPPVPGLTEEAGVFHYSPLEHDLERRATIPAPLFSELTRELDPGAFFLGFTSILWREAWKYGERAYRYCQHDVGHALAATSFAAAGLGWRVELLDHLGTEEVGALLGASSPNGPEAEHPDSLLLVRPEREGGAPVAITPAIAPESASAFRRLEWRGEPNRLSPDHVEWNAIEVAAQAATKPRTAPIREAGLSPGRAASLGGDVPLLREIVHRRRSGQNYDGQTTIARSDFLRLMESVMPREGRLPFELFPWRPRTHLALFLHRVEGFEPGLYFLFRGGLSLDPIRSALDPAFLWRKPGAVPGDLPLYLLLPRDLRGEAIDLSCRQPIAADGAFSLGMLAEFDEALATHGAWFYPRLFWEAGAIGQRLYLESEAVGLRSTGIGCYFDDDVHRLLGLSDRRLQSLYHFTIGRAVEDSRLETLPPYSHRCEARRARN